MIFVLKEDNPLITMSDIIREGHPTLREVAKEVKIPPSLEDQETLKSLLEYVKNSQDPEKAATFNLRPGIGIAAPQIDVSKRMLAIRVPNEKGELIEEALFNPKVISHSVEQAYLTSGEGCLSVDRDVPGFVPRYRKVTVKGFDINGQLKTLKLRGLPAIVFQHEIDHLNGIMFYDHINQKDPFKPIENAVAIDR
ncbi:peptide deformylase [Bacillus coahuilensis m2-6]|nr:peptide deformylase [Bacillus coahuilensis m2-6]